MKKSIFVIILMTLFIMVASPTIWSEGPKGDDSGWNDVDMRSDDDPWVDVECKDCGDDGGWGDPAYISLDDDPWNIEKSVGPQDDTPWVELWKVVITDMINMR